MSVKPIILGLLAALSIVATSASVSAQARTPRTPWGDPDLQGTYTNKYEQGTPFERPAEFAGKRMEDITPEELKQVAKRRQEQTLERAPYFGGGDVPGLGNSEEFRDIYEIYKGSRAWFVIDPADGKIPPLTEEAKEHMAKLRSGRGGQRASRTSYLDYGLYERCITRGYPGSMMPAGYGNSYDITQGPGVVAIRYEMIHETRVIPLDQRPHVGSSIHMDMGDARGHWEGDTLVVETSNLTQRIAYRNANAATLRLTERFRPTSAEKLEWTVTVDDPSTWTRPWTFSMPLTKNKDEEVLEYACHEGNLALKNMLSVERAKERK